MKGSKVITSINSLDPIQDHEQIKAIRNAAMDKIPSIPPNNGCRVTITLKPHGPGWSSKIRAVFTREAKPSNRVVVMEQLSLAPITDSDEYEKREEQRRKELLKAQKKASQVEQTLPAHMVPVQTPPMQATI